MSSAGWPDVIVRIWDVLTEHTWFVTPVFVICACSCLIAILMGHPVGLVAAIIWLAMTCSFGFSVAVPCYGWHESRRTDSRLRNLTDEERTLLRDFASCKVTSVRTFPQNPQVAGLFGDGILRRLADSFPSSYGVQVFGLSRRGEKRLRKSKLHISG